jgi:hypothetical protein
MYDVKERFDTILHHTQTHTQNLPKEVPGILSWSDEDLQELYMSTTRDVVSQINAVKGDWRDVIRSVRGAVQYVLRFDF